MPHQAPGAATERIPKSSGGVRDAELAAQAAANRAATKGTVSAHDAVAAARKKAALDQQSKAKRIKDELDIRSRSVEQQAAAMEAVAECAPSGGDTPAPAPLRLRHR